MKLTLLAIGIVSLFIMMSFNSTASNLVYPETVQVIGGGIVPDENAELEIRGLTVNVISGNVRIYTYMSGAGSWIAGFMKYWYLLQNPDHWVGDLPDSSPGETCFTLGPGDKIVRTLSIGGLRIGVPIVFMGASLTDNEPYNNLNHPGWYLLKYWKGYTEE